MYWDTRFPRLLTLSQMKSLEHTYDSNPRARKFLALADITCDIEGSVEFLKRNCTIDNPFFMYNPLTDEVTQQIEGRGVLVLGVDNLPAEFPRDASKHFSQALNQFVVPLSESDPSKPFAEAHTYLPPPIYNSCIAADGKLTPPYEYIAKMRAAKAHAEAAAANSSSSSSSSAPSNPGELSLDLMLEGHLFDTGFINQALDIFEKEKNFEVVQWVISPNRTERANNISRAIIHVTLESEDKLATLFDSIQTLANKMPSAAAKLVRLTYDDKTRTYSGIIDERFKTTISFQATGRPSLNGHSSNNVVPSESTVSSESLSTAVSRKKQPTKPKKKILVLGSGFVAGPLVEYLHRRPENSITVASAAEAEAEKLVKPFLPTEAGVEARVAKKTLNVSDTGKLRSLISKHDIVVSLLPATFHPDVARLAIELKKDMVTASYVSPAMKNLNDAAKQAGITILNEMGLDPGLDHLACAQIIEEAQSKGQKVLGFQSLCGGLPAPEAVNNPFAYKFSWSPLGMLLATQNTAIFREANKQVEIPSSRLLTSAKHLDLNPAFNLEYYANRDSLSYESVYGIAGVESMFRGTIRYAGTARLLHGYAKVGLLDRSAIVLPTATNWLSLMSKIMNCDAQHVRGAVAQRLAGTGDFDNAGVERVVNSMEWLGLFSPNEPLLRGGATFDSSRAYTPMDLLCAILQEKLQYAPGERDMVVMYHEFLLGNRDGSKTLKRSSLISYGGDDAVTNANPLIVMTPGGGGRKGYSAMSRTVGIPAAIGTQMILDGKLPSSGVIIPTGRNIYEPVLKELKENEGIAFVEEEKELH